MRKNESVALSLLVAACVVAGCTLTPPTAKAQKRNPPVGLLTPGGQAVAIAPRLVPQDGAVTTLTGKVKAISDNGAGLISDKGAAAISDNGAGIVGNNGGQLRLLATLAAREQEVAGAVVQLYDAGGHLLVDGAGKPLAATTDAQGNYSLKAVLPAGNLVVRVPLAGATGSGRALSAMVVRRAEAALTQPIDTATSLGAQYVLATYVKGDQAVYDRMPAPHAERLRLELDAARRFLTATPSYEPEELVKLTTSLRQAAPPVSRTLDDIQAVLLGQAGLGKGRPATEVPLQEPRFVAVAPNGDVAIAERTTGRVRLVGADGQMTTLVDAFNGTIKQSLQVSGLAYAKDGSLYIASSFSHQVFVVAPDGTFRVVAGNGQPDAAPLGAAALTSAISPSQIAVGPDQTLYIGELRQAKTPGVPRVLAVDRQGGIRVLPMDEAWGSGNVTGLAMAPDGGLWVAFMSYGEAINTPRLYRLAPGAARAELQPALPADSNGIIAVGPDGTLYSDAGAWSSGLVAHGPGRALTPLAGVGAPPDRVLNRLGGLAVGPDGSVFAADLYGPVVRKLTPDGRWPIVAGRLGRDISNPNALGINAPTSTTISPDGRLVISESGNNTIERFDGQSFTVLAGTVAGFSGDGGPATAAKLNCPTSLAYRGNDLLFYDLNNSRIRKVAADGTITTLAGGGTALTPQAAPGRPVPAGDCRMSAMAIAVGPDGRVYWSNADSLQIMRLSADDQFAEVVAGGGSGTGDGPAANASFSLPLGLAFDKQGDLFVSDAAAFQIRKISGLTSATPMITTVAGLPIEQAIEVMNDPTRDEEGLDARASALRLPGALCFDAAGDLIVAELGTTSLEQATLLLGVPSFVGDLTLPKTPPRIRRIARDGRVTTAAGPGSIYFPDPAAGDALGYPLGIVVDSQGRLVIIDAGTNQVRILPTGTF